VAIITLPDSRRFSYEVLGDPDGVPLVVQHGTPGSWRQLAGLAETARDRGYRVIAPDRAGYGDSTFDPRRTIGSSARDIGALLDALGIASCGIVGISGGGPTALAAGVRLGERISAIATVGGVAPMVPRDPELPADRLLIKLARQSELSARLMFGLMARAGRTKAEQALNRLASMSAEVDATILRKDASIRDAMLDDLRQASATTGRAAARDFWLFSRAWDVDISQIQVPVDVWQGTEDRNVPLAHGRVIANLCPTAELHVVEGGGHLLINQLDQILASMSRRASRSGRKSGV
jgi:pimeloyl-ACP methyl ester carboxylesterase